MRAGGARTYELEWGAGVSPACGDGGRKPSLSAWKPRRGLGVESWVRGRPRPHALKNNPRMDTDSRQPVCPSLIKFTYLRAFAPRRVRALAHAEGRQAKTDRLDARLLARFAERVRPPHHQATDEQRASLRDLLVRREQLIQMRTAEINRLTAAAPNLRPGIQKHIDWLDQEIRALEQELDNEAERTDELRRKRELLESVPGIGAITALNLLLRLPELGTINRKEAAAFVGVAPYANQSGAQHKPRHISGGSA
jgi:transposase